MIERQKDLDEQEKELEERKEALEREKREFGVGDYTSSDVIPLNVSGHITATLRRTLTMLEGSMLASRFSGRWDDSLEKDREGNFFIDQPYELFGPLLDNLRAQQAVTPLSYGVISPSRDDFKSSKAYNDFKRMVEYYGMTPLIFPTRLSAHSGTDPVAIVLGHPSAMNINAEHWGMFELNPHTHGRRVVSYEIVVDAVESFQVGWLGKPDRCTYICQHVNAGLEAHESSMALDFTRGGTIGPSTEFAQVKDANIKEGSVIRVVGSAMSGSCVYLDGVKFDLVGKFAVGDIASFSGKGKWSVTKVGLEH
jgi:hypothetical protein